MSLYDDASLVMIPSGKKDGKLYSIKPTDGSGDFTFTRDGAGASPATRVDADGNIETGRTNYLLQSNQFDTTWITSGSSVTSGQADKDGGTDAWLLSVASGTNSQRVVQSVAFNEVRTFSVYAKAGTLDWIRLRCLGGSSPDAYFDISNGVLGSTTGGSITSNIEDAGNGFYRCSVAVDDNITEVRIHLATADLNVTQSSGNIYIQDAQLEQGLVATDYIETTTTAGYAGLLGDMPRLDYSGGATCPSLLLEPSRTNQITYSNYLSGSGWTIQSGNTVTQNTTDVTSPRGLNDAVKIVSSDAATGVFFAGLTETDNATRTVYLRGASGGETVTLKDPSGFGTSVTETLTTSWERYEFKTTNDGNTYQGLFVDNISVGTIYLWECQFETGTYATSLIPTYGSTVTRAADSANLDNADAILDNTSQSIFIDVEPLGISSNNLLEFRQNGGGTGNRLLLQTNSAGALRVFFNTGGSSAFDQNITSAVAVNTRAKIMVTYTPTNVKVFVDGVKEIDTAATISFTSAMGYIDLEGSATGNDEGLLQRGFDTWAKELTDAEAIAQTTL